MSSKLIPSNPDDVTVIRKITSNITTFSAPFARFGLIKVGGRGTAVRLTSGSVAVFSPTALTPAVKETVAQMGEVKYLAALDSEHHIFIGEWHKAYPNAKVIGPEGLEDKRAKQSNVTKVPIHHTWDSKDSKTIKIDAEFDNDFDYEYVHSHVNKELVFNYRPDKTLIQADLFFNLPATEQYSIAGPNKTPENPSSGIFTNLWARMNNTQGSMIGQKRFIWYLTSSGDRSHYNQAVSRIAKWNFDRIIPCHGDVIETGGKGVFQTLMSWHLDAAKKQN